MFNACMVGIKLLALLVRHHVLRFTWLLSVKLTVLNRSLKKSKKGISVGALKVPQTSYIN